jgi:hypothetical protein
MDIVIPVADEETNPTLQYALESIARFESGCRVVLVGAVEQLPGDTTDLAHMTVQISQDKDVRPTENTDKLMRWAVDLAAITDPFIWSNDDIYWRRQVSLAELMMQNATSLGPLSRRSPDAVGLSSYALEEAITRQVLEHAGLRTDSYERHVPLLVHKDSMRHALLLGGSKRSVYGNLELPHGPQSTGRDVKLFHGSEKLGFPSEQPFFSTGAQFPVDKLRAMLPA